MSNSSGIGRDTFVLAPHRRTFVRGMADLVDFRSLTSRYAVSETPAEADARAIAADWSAVGRDLEIAYVWGKEQTVS